MKDQNFYNKESAIYSAKRYPARATNYVQYFFKRRLSITHAILKRYFGSKKGINLLEIGCADGVVMKELSKGMNHSFASMTGIDTASEMIVAARKLNQGANMNFFVRGEESRDGRYDIIIEIGVANYADFDGELAYISEHLKADGICIFSIAGKGSLNERFEDRSGYKNFLTYQEYELKMREIFTVEKMVPVGFRLPLIWRVPFVARVAQSIVEICFVLAPGFYHEKVYILKKK